MEYVVIVILALVIISLLAIIISNLYKYLKKKKEASFSYKLKQLENGMKKEKIIELLGNDFNYVNSNTLNYNNEKYDVTLKLLNNTLKSYKIRKK
jgi:uncharacterized protein YxeA